MSSEAKRRLELNPAKAGLAALAGAQCPSLAHQGLLWLGFWLAQASSSVFLALVRPLVLGPKSPNRPLKLSRLENYCGVLFYLPYGILPRCYVRIIADAATGTPLARNAWNGPNRLGFGILRVTISGTTGEGAEKQDE